MNVKKIALYEKIVNVVLDMFIIVFGIILLISIYNNIQIKILGNEYSSFFGYSTFEVQTGSMADTINAGDWIIVKAEKSIELKDVITFKKDGEFITHRVVEAYNGTYVTKGDANSSKDDAISENQIVGKVVKVIPGFGIFKKTIFSPAVLISSIITLFILSCVIRSSKHEKAGVKKRDKKSRIGATIINAFKNFKKTKNIKKSAKKPLGDKEDEEAKKLAENFAKVKMNNTFDTAYIDDEIGKTFFDDGDEIEVKEKIEEITEDETNEEKQKDIKELSPEDMDKTVYFRMVDVAKLAIDKKYTEEAEKNIEQEEKEIKIQQVITEDKVSENDIEDKLKNIQKKKKKFKNIVEKIVYLKKEETLEIISILNNNDKPKTNEPTIREELVDSYINAKYYNIYEFITDKGNGKRSLTKIDSELDAKAKSLIKNYKGSDAKYKEKVDKYLIFLLLVHHMEQTYLVVPEMQTRRERYTSAFKKAFKGELTELETKTMINKILKIQKLYLSVNNHILEKLESTTFEIKLNRINEKIKFVGVDLGHNITFNKVYSDYIVDKTYSEGIIAEDKIEVLLNLLLTKISKNIIKADFRDNYVVYLPESIYTKPNKLLKVFDLIDFEYAKNNITFLVKYNDLMRNKKTILELRKAGYHFVLTYDGTEVLKEREQKYLYIADYIFADKKMIKKLELLSNIPEDLKNYVICESILDKVSNYGGE